MKPFTLLAPAKINLTLEVLGKRPDGYHELRMLMVGVGLCDRLTFRPAPDIRLTCSDPGLGSGPDNLVVKAAHLLADTPEARRRGVAGAAIHLEKRIPLGAGLAGGSSDAALALLGLNRLWNLKLPFRKLEALAARLGSDVPFCLRSGWAVAKGRGEKLLSLQGMPRFWVVLLNPGFPVSTASVFSQVQTKPVNLINSTNKLLKILRSQKYEGLRNACVNDLEPVTSSVHPEIKKLKQALIQKKAMASQMSGSGPTVWGLFLNKSNALKAAQELKKSTRFCIAAQTLFSLPKR